MRRALLLLVLSTAAIGAPPMTQADAEKYARAKYFEFELKDAGPDWLAFVKNKEAKEKAQADEERKQESFPPRPTDDVGLRAVRVVQEEFTQVAKPREDEIRALAKTILEALAKGDLETVAADCTMYDATAKDRLELTRAYLKENKAKLQKAAKLFKPDASGFPITMFFEPPSPERGMTGQVRIAFGPKVPAPKGTPSDRFPETHQIELWWSGEVMPEANGPVNASPTTPRPKSRWRFYQVIAPWSQRPLYLQ